MQVTPHHQAHMLLSLRPVGEGTVCTATMWVLKDIEKINGGHKSFQLSKMSISSLYVPLTDIQHRNVC